VCVCVLYYASVPTGKFLKFFFLSQQGYIVKTDVLII